MQCANDPGVLARVPAWARVAVACALSWLAVSVLPAPARAASVGQLDTTFNGTGTRIEAALPAASRAAAVAIDDGGRTVIAGRIRQNNGTHDVLVARFTTDGQLDPSFSGDGWLSYPVEGDDDATALVLDPADGAILVAGTTQSQDLDVFVTRIRPDGTRDLAFGGRNDGSVRRSIGTGDDRASAIAISGGRIVVGGSAANTTGMTAPRDAFVAWFSSTGTFHAADAWRKDVLNHDDVAAIVEIPDPNGMRVGVTGTADVGGISPRPFAAIVTGSTSPPPTTIAMQAATARAITHSAEGLVVAGGTSTGDTFLARLSSTDLSLDTAFAGGVLIDDRSGSAAADSAAAVVTEVIDGASRYVVAGTAAIAGDNAFVVSRYRRDGLRDPSWNGGSHTVTQLSAASDTAHGVALRGLRVVVAGSTMANLRSDVALAAYVAGAPAYSLSVDGSGCQALPGMVLQAGGMAVTQADCRISTSTDDPGGLSVHLTQADGVAPALGGPSLVVDFDGDWTSGASEFGACLRALDGPLLPAWRVPRDAACSFAVPSWHPVPAAMSGGSLVASSTVATTGSIYLRFGIKADGTIVPGSYEAVLVASVLGKP